MENYILDKLNIYNIRKYGYTGKGIKIAIIDGGINQFSENMIIKSGYNFTDNNDNYEDKDGHGTAIASIIKSKEFGIAFDSEIYALKINLEYDQKSINLVIDAIEWCIQNKMDIINMSFGFTGYESIEFENKCREAYDSGICIVCAAGNNPMAQGLAIPANYNSTIAISSIDDNNKISDKSSFGKGVDFCCYGEGISAYDLNGKIINVSGTSFAAPCVSAIIALLKEQNSSLTCREIYELLKDNALKPDKYTKKSLYYGYGVVKAFILPKQYKNETKLILEDLKRNIYFPYTNLKVKSSDTVDSNLKFLPDDNDPTSVIYKIYDNNIAIVNTDGFVTGKRVGNTTLTAIMDNSRVALTNVEVYGEEVIDTSDEILNFKGLNIRKLHDMGIKGKGIKVAYIGYGCIDTDKINLKKRIDIAKDDIKDANGFGTIYCSLIAGREMGIAPECELYAVRCSTNGGVVTWNNAQKAIQWCIDNKMDIINFSFTNPNAEITKTLLKKCYDNNIIAVVNVCDNLSGPSYAETSDYSITVSYIDDKKQFIEEKYKKPFTGEFVDCVSYGYGVECINSQNRQMTYEKTEAPVPQYYCNIAMAQVMGILALLRQQNSGLKTAHDIRSLLPKVCETLYNSKNDKTGYGLLKAEIL